MNLISRDDCQKILNRSVNNPTRLVSFKITQYNEGVAGFLGEHLKLTIVYEDKGVKQKSYFIKTLPLQNLNQLQYITDSGIFKKEIILYRNLLTELNKIGKFAPNAYFIRDDLLVLEDLRAKGFRMLSKKEEFSASQINNLICTLARYHASTLIYEHQKDVTLNAAFVEEIKETCFSFVKGEFRNKWLISNTHCIENLIKKLKLPAKYDISKICKQFRSVIDMEMEEFLLPSLEFRNVLTHDDLWCNNMVFNEKNECLMVDFQMARYTPPAIDFLLTVYLNVNCGEAERNLSEFVDVYLLAFWELLEKFKLNGEYLLSREEFERTLEIYRLSALIETTFYLTHTLVSDKLSNEIMDNIENYNEFSFINRSKFVLKEWDENEFYRGRLAAALGLMVDVIYERNLK